MNDYIVKYLTTEGRIMEWEVSGDTPEEATNRVKKAAGEEVGTVISIVLV